MFSSYLGRQVAVYRVIGLHYGSYAQVGYVALRVAIPLTIGKLVAPYAALVISGVLGF